ncbi:MAG: hypothetical protein S0880_08720 [Actinomycetota bacterium]|nr:hypothetical protein [Actinomycetota bacterium]
MTHTLRPRAAAAAIAVLVAATVAVAPPSGAQDGILVREDFATGEETAMEAGPGGWEVSGSRYITHDPVRTGAGTIGNSNLALHERVLGNDISITTRLEAEETAGAWDDFSVVLGYQDPDNYLFVSFNESDDDMTSGIFAVVDGVGRQLSNMTTPFEGGRSYRINVTRYGDVINAWAGYQSHTSNPYPLTTATTDLFPIGRAGVGSRNNAVLVDSFHVHDATGPGGPPYFVPEQGIWWDSTPVPVSGGWQHGSLLTDPITSGAGAIGNSNLSVTDHGALFPGDWQLFAELHAVPTASAWDDASIVFGYQDPDNYLFVSFNETNDPWTSGVFAVVDGVGTELTDLDVPIRAGRAYDVRVDRWGDDIWVYLDGRLVAEATTDLFADGDWGFGTRNNAATFALDHLEFWAG